MAYIGQNADGNFTTSVSKDTFSGDDSTTAFTLSEGATTNTVDVFVENIRQEPTTAYSVDGTTLTFTAAPVTGTDNIYVVNRGPIQLSASHPAAQALTAHSATITTDLTVDTDTLFVDSTNNRVGIGTTSPTRTLYVDGQIGASGRIHTADGSATDCALGIGDDNTGLFRAATNSIGFSTNGSERMRILSGGGLTFNGDTAAANALDDYEEGTFTPTYSFSSGGGSFSYSIQVGYYTKVGRFVFVMIRIRGQKSGTGSGVLQIAGLPFTVANVTNLFGTGAIGFTNNWNNRPMGAYIEANNNKITLTKGANSSNTYSDLDTTVVNADPDTGSTSSNDLILTISYIT